MPVGYAKPKTGYAQVHVQISEFTDEVPRTRLHVRTCFYRSRSSDDSDSTISPSTDVSTRVDCPCFYQPRRNLGHTLGCRLS